ncbi:hypothetical protein SO802_022276 [Lithocarpus litseifolius]|uniref:Uncharacterized protein n=1 Tax=Lithocarpus litseifolius TaxID=425828 RepID=A0AAW2CM30_9ROSI
MNPVIQTCLILQNKQNPLLRPRFIIHKFIQTWPFSSGNNSNPADSAIPVVSTISSPSDASQPIDAGSSIRKPICLWPGMYHSPVTNALWEARSSIFENVVDTSTDGASQEELVKKTPGQSRTSIVYKFSSDYILRGQYRNPWNEIRMGKLLEDLDALAGTIAFKVDVGNFLRFKSCVLYTELENPAEPLINVEVVAHVTRPEFRRSEDKAGECIL